MTASVMMEQAFGVPTFQDAGLPVPQKVNADELSLVEAKAGAMRHSDIEPKGHQQYSPCFN